MIKNIHEKLMHTVQTMLIDTVVNLPYYGEFNLHVNFVEQESIGTCAINVTSKGMNFYYSPKFLKDLSQKEVNFITLHEDFHLLFDHPKRTLSGQYDHKLSNIVQDMIINHVIWEDIVWVDETDKKKYHTFVEIPKTPDGKNMALFVPVEYEGKLIFEELYEWMKEKKDKWDEENKDKEKKECKKCKGSGTKKSDDSEKGDKSESNESEKGDKSNDPSDGSGEGENDCDACDGTGSEGGKDSSGKPSYGPHGKNPTGGTLDTWSTDQIFQDLKDGKGDYMDKHIDDDVPSEMREGMIKDVMDRLSARGLSDANVEKTLNKLRKKRKDYLKEIKRSVANMIFGTNKQKTISRPNRRQISGLKGNRKIKTKINCILDTSGSMGGQGTFERVLSYIYRNDIEINLIESDTKIKWVENIKSAKKLQSLPIKGLGGTIMQSGIDYVCENFNEYNTVLLTDGYTDTLDLSKLKGKLLIISTGVECPIGRTNNRVKQIVLDSSDK